MQPLKTKKNVVTKILAGRTITFWEKWFVKQKIANKMFGTKIFFGKQKFACPKIFCAK